jgi:hypothetical protein
MDKSTDPNDNVVFISYFRLVKGVKKYKVFVSNNRMEQAICIYEGIYEECLAIAIGYIKIGFLFDSVNAVDVNNFSAFFTFTISPHTTIYLFKNKNGDSKYLGRYKIELFNDGNICNFKNVESYGTEDDDFTFMEKDKCVFSMFNGVYKIKHTDFCLEFSV